MDVILLRVFMLLFGLFLFLRPNYAVKSTGQAGAEKMKSVKALGAGFMSMAVIGALFAIFHRFF